MRRLAIVLALLVAGTGCGPATMAGAVRASESTRTVVLPARGPRAVDVSDEMFAATMAWLTEDMRVTADRARLPPGSGGGGMKLLHAEELRRGYAAWCESLREGPDCEGVLQGGDFTDETKRSLALAIALRSAWAGVEEEAEAMVSPGRLAGMVAVALTAYGALWVAPELVVSKGVAAIITGTLWLYLGSELLDVARAWVELTDTVDAATSFDVVRVAGENFGRRGGRKTMRLFVLVATSVLAPKGGDVAATLRELPGFDGAAAAIGVEGGGATVSSILAEARAVEAAKEKLTVLVPAGVAVVTSATSAPAQVTAPTPATAPVTAPRGPFKAYSSYKAFKRAMGSAGPGKEWHHLVEQTPGNVAKFGARQIHNTDNIIALDKGTHQKISVLYSRIDRGITGSDTITVRQWLKAQSYEAQREFGLRALQNVRRGIW